MNLRLITRQEHWHSSIFWQSSIHSSSTVEHQLVVKRKNLKTAVDLKLEERKLAAQAIEWAAQAGT